MVRPLKSANPKKKINVCVDPEEWNTFRTLVAAKLPKTSASSHLEHLMRNENRRLSGEGGTHAVDVANLDRQINVCEKRLQEIKSQLYRRGAAERDNFIKLFRAYNLDQRFTNGEDFIRRMMRDYSADKGAGTPLQEFLKGDRSESDISLAVTYVEISMEHEKLKKQVLEARKAQYLPPYTLSQTQESGQKEEARDEQTEPETKQQETSLKSSEKADTEEEGEDEDSETDMDSSYDDEDDWGDDEDLEVAEW